MTDKTKEQPLEEIVAGAVDEAAAPAADSDVNEEGAEQGQPSAKKWANLFETPEKLEEAYGHIYRAFHAKSRELQQTRQALDNLVQTLTQPQQPADAATPPEAAFQQPVWGEQPASPSGASPEILNAVLQAQQAAQEAREMGEQFLFSSLESQVRGFFQNHSELGGGDEDFEKFAQEVAVALGPVDAESLSRLPDALERAYRVIHYPEAVRDARRQQEEEERAAESYVVEGSGAGSMSMPRNQARETSFRRLVQRLKTESGL